MKSHMTAVALVSFVASLSGAQLLSQDDKLVANEAEDFDNFGQSVAIADGVLMVGVPNDGPLTTGAVIRYDVSSGAVMDTLMPVGGGASFLGLFGWDVDADGGHIVVGAPEDSFAADSAGVAYLFDATDGSLITRFFHESPSMGDNFGYAVAVDDGVVAVGSRHDDEPDAGSGSVFLFDASTGSRLLKVVPNDAQEDDSFGLDVQLDGGLLAVGAPFVDDNGSDTGAAYLFDADPSSPTFGAQLIKLYASDADIRDRFGRSVALGGGVLAVGAASDDENGFESGAVYLFDADPASPTFGDQIAKVMPESPIFEAQFGWSVAIEGADLVVGAKEETVFGADSGAVYLFKLGRLRQRAKLLPTDGGPNFEFGASVAIAGGIIAIGSPNDDDAENNAGSVYLFDINPCSPADVQFPLGVLDFSDVAEYLVSFAAGDLDADLAAPFGSLGFSDVTEFLSLFGAGCPN